MLINNDTIVKDTDPIIREKSEIVTLPLSKEDETLLREMLQYVKDSTDEEKAEKMNLRPAVGISAIQVGVKKQMTAVVVDDLDKNGDLNTLNIYLLILELFLLLYRKHTCILVKDVCLL